MTDEGLFDNETAQKSYVQTFAEAGYDLVDGDPKEVAERIRESPVMGPVLAAIDNWALVCAYDMKFVPNREAEYRQRRDRLLEVARTADPDPELRDKIRSPHVWDDLRQLEQLAERVPQTDLSPRLADLLAELLSWAKGNPEPLLRAYQSRHPNDFWLNFNLAKRLTERRHPEALQFYQAALAVRPHHIGLYVHIGGHLGDRRHWDRAIAVLREALARLPEDAADSIAVRGELARILMDKGDPEEGVKLFRENVRIGPNQVGNHLNLGRGLEEMGRFPEALDSFRRGRELAAQTGSPFRERAESLVREGERLVEREHRLETGKPEPTSAKESHGFAVVCYWKKRYADAVGFYRRAYEQDPKWAAGILRYKAAWSAALAAAGRGEATEALDAPRRAELRKLALAWIRIDLDVWSQHARDLRSRPEVEATLRLWQRHPNFASLRDSAVAQLPDGERQTWEQFWADVNALLGKVQAEAE